MIRALALVCAAVLVAACGGGEDDEPVRIDWDLTESHAMADVDWPRPDISGTQIEGLDGVRVLMPGGKVFEEPAARVRAVTMSREGDVVDNIAFESPRLSADDARALAQEWARRYGLGGEVRPGLDDTILDTADPVGGPGGPTLTVEIRDAGSPAETPWIVSFQLLWRDPAPAAPPAP